jgi:hypothetical protein
MFRSLLFLAAVAAAPTSLGVIVAYDDASDPTYNSGWANGSNGGFGFSPWSHGNTGNTGGALIISSSMGNGSGGGPGIDTPGNRAWTIQSNQSNHFPHAFRGWSHVIQPGDTFSVDLDTGWPNASFSIQQFGLYGAGNTMVFIIAQSGSANYQYWNGSNYTDSGVALTDGGIRATFQWTSPTNCLAGITVLSTSNTTFKNITAGLPTGNLAVQTLGAMTNQDFYINRMQIDAVPEPASLAAVSVGCFALLRRRRVR